MRTSSTNLRLASSVGAFAILALVVAACSSSGAEATPTRPVRPPEATEDAGGTTTDSGPVDPGCAGPDGCYKCEPAKPIEFLNACTDRTCVPFDNKARLPLLEDGKPLPPVP